MYQFVRLVQVVHGFVIAAVYVTHFALWPQAAGLGSLNDLWPKRLPPLKEQPADEFEQPGAGGKGGDATKSKEASGSADEGVLRGGGWLCGGPLKLAVSFGAQSVAKHCLTEGDRIVLSFAATPRDQAGRERRPHTFDVLGYSCRMLIPYRPLRV